MKTYHDVFVEQLVRRRRPGGEAVFRLGAILLGLILITLAFVLARNFFPVLFALVVILEFFAFVYTVKEFEYSFISGDVDIDLIRGKRKRSTIFSCSCRDISLMAPCGTHEEALSEPFTRTTDASESTGGEGRWFFICQREDGSRELVYLTPNERLLDAFSGYLGRKMDYKPQTGHKLTAE